LLAIHKRRPLAVADTAFVTSLSQFVLEMMFAKQLLLNA
jgi:hypothetical protein